MSNRLDQILAARERIGTAIPTTPLLESRTFGNMAGYPVWLKLENLQYTGAFKERGALNRILGLSAEERQRGIIAASAGNHAQGVAYHCQRLGLKCSIVMPENTPLIKVSNVRYHGAEVILHGSGYDDAFGCASAIMEERGMTFVHPFDDMQVIAGQGTIGLEMLEQNPELQTVVVPVGGGGLASGVAIALKEQRPDIRVIGVQSASAPAMTMSFQSGAIVEMASTGTIADGIAVKCPGELTHYLLGAYVDEMLTVSDDEIAMAILNMLELEKTLVEGAGAAALAAVLTGKVRNAGQTGIVISGGNIDVTLLARIINLGLVKTGRQTKLMITLPNRVGELHQVTGVIRETGASVVQALHDHSFTMADMKVLESVVEFTLETRGPDHIATITRTLRERGYRVLRPMGVE